MVSQNLLFVGRSTAATALFPRLREAGVEAGLVESLQGALSYIERRGPVAVFTEPSLPGYRASELLKALSRRKEPGPEVFVFADKGSAQEARQLMELGARDYWLAPLTWEKIQAVLPAREKEIQSPPTQPVPPAPARGHAIIGQHPVMQKALALARRVAPSKATILISGESGTGKELFARYIHEHSDRTDGMFIAVNCAALPEHLLESELFGHERGAFTGAVARKLGRFELADRGALLLDEISEMDLSLQAKLLRVLQEGEIDRVGGTETVGVDVRVLATTNRDLGGCVQEGRFRQDLFYRLNVIPLTLPPLRERGKDVLLLAEHFMRRFCRQYSVESLSFSTGALRWLEEYDWPGNVRELQNLMERAVLLSGAGTIRRRHFLLDGQGLELDELGQQPQAAAGGPGPGPEGPAGPPPGKEQEVQPLSEVEKHMILKGLGHTQGNRTKAADLLGISVRTLRNKLNEYRRQGLEIP